MRGIHPPIQEPTKQVTTSGIKICLYCVRYSSKGVPILPSFNSTNVVILDVVFHEDSMYFSKSELQEEYWEEV